MLDDIVNNLKELGKGNDSVAKEKTSYILAKLTCQALNLNSCWRFSSEDNTFKLDPFLTPTWRAHINQITEYS